MEIEKAAQGVRRGAYVRRCPELKAVIVAACLAPDRRPRVDHSRPASSRRPVRHRLASARIRDRQLALRHPRPGVRLGRPAPFRAAHPAQDRTRGHDVIHLPLRLRRSLGTPDQGGATPPAGFHPVGQRPVPRWR